MIAVLLALLVQAADKPVTVAVAPQDTTFRYEAQVLADLDQEVGESLHIAGQTHPVKIDEKGKLEVDVKADGKFRSLNPKREIVTFAVKGEGDKAKTINAKFEFRKDEAGKWVVRNLTQLVVSAGAEQFVVVDANANGVWNEAGIDGLTWAGRTWLFPLPSADERWCSESMDFTGLSFGKCGETPSLQGRPLATTNPLALPVLQGVNEERVALGLTPRPEDPKLSEELQAHCKYMAMNNILTHPEEKGKPGYSKEGHEAGMRSILSRGMASDRVAVGMVGTYFHRQDVIRPDTLAFGVGYEGNFGGIDGRTKMGAGSSTRWPVVCPVPNQQGVPLQFNREAPDPIPGDQAAGFPITAYFGTASLKLKSHSLKAIAGPGIAPSRTGTPVECYVYDPQTGVEAGMTKYQRCVALIPKDPLLVNVEYEVSLEVELSAETWKRTWRFNTTPAQPAKNNRRG